MITGAACQGKDTAIFFPTEGRHPHEALAICSTCPGKRQCLETFIDEIAGVFGGTTGRDRRQMRAERSRVHVRSASISA
jgi:hypothetical protein